MRVLADCAKLATDFQHGARNFELRLQALCANPDSYGARNWTLGANNCDMF
jgi:hypothetical protein